MITVLLAMFIWAMLHSLLAGQGIKQRIRRRLGDRAYHGFYRLGYNLFATITFAPVLWIALVRSGVVVWSIPAGWMFVSLAIQVVGLIGLVTTLIQIDLPRFAGLSQARAYLTGNSLPLTHERLQTGGLYALVRHPLYLFSLLAIWPLPVMTEGILAFNVAATLYFVVGSRFEERRLVAAFGQEYVEYRRRVPWLIPVPRSLWSCVSHQILR